MSLIKYALVLALATSSAQARGPKPEDLASSDLAVGDQGVVWYTTWDTAKAEAKRSNRPIFFMAAAHQCGSISGTF